MNKLLLLGSGMLQENLASVLEQRVDAIERHNTKLNACDAAALVQATQPRWIVYAGPLSESAWDVAAKPAHDWSQESKVVEALATNAELVQAKFVLLSSDAIFAGPRLFHEEDSALNASDSNVIGRALVEQAALRASPNALVLRTHAFGWSRSNRSFAETIYSALADCRPIELDSHAHATPMLASDLAWFVERALRLKVQGLCHCTGAERTNQVRFAQDIAAVAGFDSRLIQPRTSEDNAVALATPCRETSLNCRRARRAFETPMPLLREGIERMMDQLDSGYRQRLLGMQQVRELVAA